MSGSKYRAVEGLNRVSTAIKTATSTSRRLRTNDITSGQIVELEFAASTEETAPCRVRATGAVVIAQDFTTNTFVVGIEAADGTLTVRTNANTTGTITLRVF